MRGQTGALGVEVGPDVDPVRDLPGGRSRRQEGRGVELVGREPTRDGYTCTTGKGFAWQGRLEHARSSPGEVTGDSGHAMQLNVVGVPIAAGGVVTDEDVGVLLVEDLGDTLGGVAKVEMGEAVGVLGMETGVRVAERDHAGDAQCPGRVLEFAMAALGEVRCEIAAGEAGGSVRGHDQDDSVTLGGSPRHGSGGQQGLVVRVGVAEHQRGHRDIVVAGCTRERLRQDRGVRIAHVSDCYLPRTGGIETQVRALAHAQIATGDDVRIITATPGHGDVRAGIDHDDGLPVFRVAAHLPAELPVHPRTAHHVREILRRDPVDVVHIHAGVVSPFAWGALRAAHAVGLPTVITVHSMWGPVASPSLRVSRLVLPWVKDGVAMTAVSHVAAERVRAALGVPVGVIPNGIDPELWPVVPWSPMPGRLRLVSVLRLAPRKRAGALIDVISDAAARLPAGALSAVIIGDGPERDRLQRKVVRRGLAGAITLAGRRDPTGIRVSFADADAFIQASVRESFGIAALEARASGLPVVARAETGAGEFVEDGVTGLLVGSDAEMVDALVDLSTHPERLAVLRAAASAAPPPQEWPLVLNAAREAYRRATA